MRSFSITCFGSSTRDVFVQVDQDYFKKNLCFLPGSKVDVLDMGSFSGGGATNTAVGFSRLGLDTAIVSAVGNDNEGEEIRKELAREKVDCTNLVTEKNKRTSYSAIITGFGKDRVILNYTGATAALEHEKKIKWDRINSDWLFVSSLHGKGELLKKIFAHAKKTGTRIGFNPGKKEIESGLLFLEKFFEQVAVLSLNAQEAFSLTGKTGMEKNLAALGKHCRTVVITDGKNKVHCMHQGKIFSAMPPNVSVVDTSGAGDAFNAGFVSAVAKGKNVKEALLWGNVNACSVVQYIGTKNILLSEKGIKKFIAKTIPAKS